MGPSWLSHSRHRDPDKSRGRRSRPADLDCHAARGARNDRCFDHQKLILICCQATANLLCPLSSRRRRPGAFNPLPNRGN